jgi:F-type H+-transporting ATPase subunit c
MSGTTSWRQVHKKEQHMKKAATILAVLVVVLILAPGLFAQTDAGAAAAAKGTNWLAISGAFGMALAAAGCGYAQSKIGSSACEGMARNPGAADAIRGSMILGLVFVETLALFTLVIIFTLIFKG